MRSGDVKARGLRPLRHVRSFPFLASLVVHAGALIGLGLTCAHSRTAYPQATMLLRMQETEPVARIETPEPLDIEPPEPVRHEVTIEPEPAPDEPATDDEHAIEFESPERSPEPTRVLPAPVRITSLRREPPAPEPAPEPRQAVVAAHVTAAVPHGECRPPRYPATAQRLGEEGHVLLSVHVGVDGGVLSVEVEESSGYGLLDEAAVAAVREWTFEPAREGGRAVESLVRVPFRFRLRA